MLVFLVWISHFIEATRQRFKRKFYAQFCFALKKTDINWLIVYIVNMWQYRKLKYYCNIFCQWIQFLWRFVGLNSSFKIVFRRLRSCCLCFLNQQSESTHLLLPLKTRAVFAHAQSIFPPVQQCSRYQTNFLRASIILRGIPDFFSFLRCPNRPR